MRSYCHALAALLLFFGLATAGEKPAVSPPQRVKFVKAPSVKKSGGKTVIEFAADRKTDVAVYVLNAKGEVVRHLVAGMLGENPPKPLKPGLSQSLAWDGKDDLGKPATGGPFRARVGLGFTPQFDRMIGWNPAFLGSVRALAASPKGEILVFHVFGTLHNGDGTLACSVFDRDGNYLREILPYAANLPDEKLKGIRRIQLEDGKKVPFFYQAETRSIVPGATDIPAHEAIVTGDGRVGFIGRMEYKRYGQPGPVHMIAIGADGGIREKPVRALICGKRGLAATLALSPDGKTVYASGVQDRAKNSRAADIVYRFGWNDAQAKPFLGGKGADGEKALKGAKGIACDAEGNIYVCDKGNNRVAIFKPDGSFLGALKVQSPERVAVSRKTGAAYVCSPAGKKLWKFASRKAAKAAAEIDLRLPKYGTPVMVLEESAGTPCIFVGVNSLIWRIADKGGAFGPAEDFRSGVKKKGPRSVKSVSQLSVDRKETTLYVRGGGTYNLRSIVDLATGKLSAKGGYGRWSMSLGKDGNFYVQASGRVTRYGPDLKKKPFAKGNQKGELPVGNMRLRCRGITADPAGNVYVLRQKPKNKLAKGDAGDANYLCKFSPEGKILKEKVIDSNIRSLNSVRVDYQGNIYLALGLRPGKKQLPPGLEGKVPEGKSDPAGVCGVNYYPFIYGSIVKFGPEGGQVGKGIGGVACNYNNVGHTTDVKGARWIFAGASNVPSWRTPGPDICLCESPRFDVDGFGRSFFPDAGRCRVGVVDTAGNSIGWFGEYGNQDSAGPKSAVPTPAIPLFWPQAVAVGDTAVYVGDRLNRRVVRAKITYAAEATCPISR